jgi:hypothetical protein
MKEMVKGYQPEGISDSNKQQIASKIMKDMAYFKKLNDYMSFMRILENKYRISKFSNEDWGEVARFGAKHGIYFISAIQKFKEPKNKVPGIPDYFPRIPLKKITDTIPSPNSIRQ